MIFSNYKKTLQQSKPRQLNTCLLKSINTNSSLALDFKPSCHTTSIENKSSTMSTTMATDLRTAAATAAAAIKTKSPIKPPMEAVVVNSVIYSKPSFCSIVVDLRNEPDDKSMTTTTKTPTTTKLTNGSCPSNIFQNETFCTSSMDLKNTAMNTETSSYLAGLFTQPSTDVDEDAQLYRMCTTINGSIHHQISNFCDSILTMAEIFNASNDDHDDDSFIEFAYDDDDNDDDDDDDDDEKDYIDEDDDNDYDVVDFCYECPIKPAPKLSCDKKKKVRFNTKPTVHVMHTWSYAYRAARKGDWEMYARDRERFKLRIQRTASTLNPILDREHRQKIYEKRFANLGNIDNDQHKTLQQHQMEDAKNATSAEMMMETEMKTSNNVSKKTHQKKKRKKKRFCKMGNKHYF